MISAVFKGFHKKEDKPASGNAMVYVLVAIALFGILTATLSSQNNQSDGQDLDDELAEFYATELIEYAAAAKNVVDQMIITGTTIDQLNFVNPTSAAFDIAPHIHKVFHPQGGGLNYLEKFSSEIETLPDGGWYIQSTKNVEWTNSTNTDIILTAHRVNKTVCEKINTIITGSTTLPALTVDIHSIFIGSSANTLDTITCANCEGQISLCIENDVGTHYAFYSILAGR